MASDIIRNVNWGGRNNHLSHVSKFLKDRQKPSSSEDAVNYIINSETVFEDNNIGIAVVDIDGMLIGYSTGNKYQSNEIIEYKNNNGKYSPIWVQEKRMKVRAEALQVKTAETAKGWVEGKLIGFRPSKTNEYIIASFRLTDTGDKCSFIYNNPIKLTDINKLLSSMGIGEFKKAEDITLPEEGDTDMMGMDTPIMIKVKAKGDFLNATDFKSAGMPSANAPW